MKDTVYLTLRQVLSIHERQIEEFGGTSGIRDAGLIEASLLRPQTGYYFDIIEEAAALWESLTMNHGFIDGNKRIGFACLYIFLSLNGYRISASENETLTFVINALETGSFRKDNLDRWLRKNTIQR